MQKYCGNCGTEAEEGTNFCFQCGAKITSIEPNISHLKSQNSSVSNYYQDNAVYTKSSGPRYSHRQYRQIRQKKDSTGLLIIVLIINWLGVGILLLAGILFLLIVPIFGIIILVITALFWKLTLELQRHNNTARWITIVLLVLGFLVGLADLDIISFLITIFQLYVLLFEKNTIALFEE